MTSQKHVVICRVFSRFFMQVDSGWDIVPTCHCVTCNKRTTILAVFHGRIRNAPWKWFSFFFLGNTCLKIICSLMVRSVGFCEFSFVNQHFMEHDMLRSDIGIDRQDRNSWLQVSLDSRCVTYVFNPNIMTIWHNYWYNIDFTWALGGFAQSKNPFCKTNSFKLLPPFQVGQYTPLSSRNARRIGVDGGSFCWGRNDLTWQRLFQEAPFFFVGGEGTETHILWWSSGKFHKFWKEF